MPFKKHSFLNTSRITVAFAIAALFLSLISLAGWLLNFANLTTFIPGLGWTGMKANTAVGFLLAGTSLILPTTHYQKKIKLLLALIVLLLGTITVAEYTFHWNAQVDELFFKEKIIPAGLHPGRMIPLAAVGFIFLGISLLLLTVNKDKFRKLAEFSVIIILAISFIGLAGYLYNVSSLYKNKGFTNATIPASLAFLLLSLAVLFSNPQAGLIAVFTEKTRAAKMGTLQIVSIISILLVIGWLTLQGFEAGFYDTQFGISIMIAVFIVSFFFVTKYSIKKLNKSEKEKESLLQQNEKNSTLIKEVFERVNDPFIALDKNWHFTYVNKKAAELARRTPQDLLGKNIWEEFPEALISDTYKVYTRAMAEQCYMANTGYFAPLNLWHESYIYPSPEGLSVYVRDITEKKIAEKELEDSQKKYRSLFENSPDGILLTVPEGKILAANTAACSIFGMTEEEIIKAGRNGIVDTTDPNLALLIQERLVTGKAKGELTFYRKDGSKFPGEVTSVKFKDASGEERSSMIIRDISEQKIAADKLKENETKYRTLMEKAGDSIIVFNATGQILDANESALQLLGYNEEEYKKMSLLDFVFPEEVKVNPFLFERLDNGQSTMTARRLKRKDGTAIDTEIHSKKISDNRYLAVARDLTERIKAEKKIFEKDLQLREISASIPGFIYQFVLEPTGEFRFAYISDSVKAVIGISPEDAYENVNNAFARVHSDDMAGLFTSIDISAQTLRPWSYDFRIMRPADKSIQWIRGNSIPQKREDGSILWNGAMFDITEVKKAEEVIRKSEKKFRDLLEATPDAMVIVNEKGQILMTNQQTENIFGYTKNELYNQPVEILMPAGFRHNHEEQRKSYVADSKVRLMGKSLDLTAKRKDGEVFPVEISLSPLVTEEGIFISAAIRDITERKKAAESLEESYQSIRKLTEHLQNIREEERTSIAREIHDELGQQLTVMMMDVSWLDKRVGAENEAARKKIKDLLVLMEDTVKTVRRISTQLRPSVLDDLGLLVAMDLQLKEFSKRSGICTNLIVPKIEPLLPETVKNGLFRIFQESLTNVARHSGAKNVRVQFGKKDGKIILTIEDNGNGFDESKVAAKKTLGVLGMKERAAVMGGEYLISGAPGKGTTIVVSVPLKEKESHPLN